MQELRPPKGVRVEPKKRGRSRGLDLRMPSFNVTGTGRIRTCNQGIMLPTSAFAALFRFVVWTIPSRQLLNFSTCRVCRLASTPSAAKTPALEITAVSAPAWLGIGMPLQDIHMA